MADNVAFLYCVFEVNLESTAWRKVIAGVVAGMEGIPTCDVDGVGNVVVTGRGKPQAVLRIIGKSGKEAKLRDMKSGQCSSILDLRYTGTSVYNNKGCIQNYCYNTPYGGYGQNYYSNPNRPFDLGFLQSRNVNTITHNAVHTHSVKDLPKKSWCCLM